MAKGFTLFTFLLVCVFANTLCGCHSHTRPADLMLSDESVMQQMLKGTWILQEYEDSIDAGLTPRLLEYMLDGPNQITYMPAKNELEIRGIFEQKELGRFWDDSRKVDSCAVDFAVAAHKFIFTIIEHNNASKRVIDTAEIVVNGTDTLLRLYNDSSSLDFVKYDGVFCPGISAYAHLINSRFISGKYYTVADTGRQHHIIFTKCGGIEGAENIAPDLRVFDSYATCLAFDHTGPDQIRLYSEKGQHADTMNAEVAQLVMSWEVVEDSLILHRNEHGAEDDIVLVKSR